MRGTSPQSHSRANSKIPISYWNLSNKKLDYDEGLMKNLDITIEFAYLVLHNLPKISLDETTIMYDMVGGSDIITRLELNLFFWSMACDKF